MDYILWGISWPNLQMMLADAPRYTTKQEVKPLESFEDAQKFLGITEDE